MVVDMWAAQAISAAADLGIADVPKGGMTADELAAAVNADARRRRTQSSAQGIDQPWHFRAAPRRPLRPHPDGRPAASRRRGIGGGLGAMGGFARHREHWSHFTEAIRTGRAVVPALRGKPTFDYLADEPELGDIFNQAMTSGSELSRSHRSSPGTTSGPLAPLPP
jgi:hypothetical protein